MGNSSDDDDESTESQEDDRDDSNDDNSDVDDEDVDPCADLEAENCSDNYDDDGAQVCALNIETQDCYEIVQSRGIYGKGNFDDGYNAAQAQTQQETQQLNTVVGVMGGLIAVLVLVIAGGAYWTYSQKNKGRHSMEDSEEHYRQNMRLDTAEDAEPMIMEDDRD